MRPPSEPRYLQVRVRRPASAWPFARLGAVLAVAALVALLATIPETGLFVFWDLLVPLLPAAFLLAPGLWRNVCPMAATNQMPRVLGITRGLALPRLLERHGLAIGLVAFLALASSRKAGLEDSAGLVALMIGAAMLTALIGGFAFRGKSGFCGSVCPLRGVQGLYGQTPFARVEPSHCRPCVGCTTNCPDVKPESALADDLAEEDRTPGSRYRRLLAGAFPGFVAAFYLVPGAAEVGLATMYARFAVLMLASLGLFFVLESVTRLGAERLSAFYGAASFGLFYWFAVPDLAAAIGRLAGGPAPEWAVWEAKIAMASLALVWLGRTLRKIRARAAATPEVAPVSGLELPMAPEREAAPVAVVAGDQVPVPAPAPEPRRVEVVQMPAASPAPRERRARPRPPKAAPVKPAPRPMAGTPAVPVPDRRSQRRPLRTPNVTIMPEGRRLQTAPGATLLDVADGNELGVESGCRMGICGCDPVYVCDGMENLSPAGDDERATIDRLGFPANTRMACVARVQGDVVISLDPADANGTPQVAPPAAAPVEPARAKAPARPIAQGVERVVVIGNGIAGVTAADHIRRHHGECSIDVITDERHPFYNRTSVTRLIHARTGMHRMHLLPDSWYEERRINSWLNTSASRIDRAAQEVELATGERLPYDRLIIATGASAHIPAIAGSDLDGTFGLRGADDAMRIREFAQRSTCRRAVVIGGGVLGLEAAEALLELDIDVTVIERAFWLAPAQLDARAGRILREHVEGLGIEVALGTGVRRIHGVDRVAGVELGDGSVRTADLALVCAGIQPNTSLAKDAGLEVKRGIVVDERMRTSDPAIFAAGDVAEHAGTLMGLWGAAVEQAEVAAMNALGSGTTYATPVVPTHLKLSNLDVTSIGDPHGAVDDEGLVPDDEDDGVYRKLVLSDGRITGAILVGRPAEAAPVLTAMREGRDVSGDLEILRAGDWEVLNESEFDQVVATAPEARHAAKPPAPGARKAS
jgi:nitrite reductase (NADH) large subunit